MTMKNLQILKYLKKILPVIVVICLLATCAVYFKLSRANTYIASEVIHYNDEQAEKGLAPTGEKLDVNEIRSSAVVSRVVDKMGLTGIYSVDSLISRIDITPIPDADKIAQKDAKIEEGEEYIYEPSTFIVSFAASSGEGPDFARTILDEILDVYFEQFSQKYVNVAPANNTVDNLNKNNYDYIEMMELIDESIDNTLNTLYQRMDQNSYYRSTETGVSFAELADDFNYLKQVNVSSLFSTIYKYQITKNKSVLVSDYTTRIDNNNISNRKDESLVEDIVTVIDAYVTKMRESGNTNISYEYILDNLHERDVQDYFGDQTVTYDELIYSWRDRNESREHAIIDSAYCRYVLDTFTSCKGNCNGICQSSALTCTELGNGEYAAVKADVEQEIDLLLDKLSSLYDTTMKTNEEYNKFLGASYISVLSSASVRESVNVKLYTAIAFFFLMVLCCGGTIVLGRMADIVNYIFYTDHLTGFSNRAYFDKYLKAKDKKLLDNGVVYCIVDITNLAHINNEHSRDTGDEIILTFRNYLKETFGKSKTEYIYNGNGSFVMLTEESDHITVEDIMRLFRLRLDEREGHKDVVIEYKIGIAETFKENKTARKLLSEAIENKKEYISDLTESL
ncbi:MAG: diguanylate cyclase [Ruminococcaceae bacterium]|nr:diguanylate cyclase [Oscillospiraceae bacterium]